MGFNSYEACRKLDTSAPRLRISPGAKLATDFGPLLLFVIVNIFAPVPPIENIFVATATFLVATVIVMAWCRMA